MVHVQEFMFGNLQIAPPPPKCFLIACPKDFLVLYESGSQ